MLGIILDTGVLDSSIMEPIELIGEKVLVVSRLNGTPFAIFAKGDEESLAHHSLKTNYLIDVGVSKIHGCNIIGDEERRFSLTTIYCSNSTRFFVDNNGKFYDFEIPLVSSTALDSITNLYVSNLMRGKVKYDDFNTSTEQPLMKELFKAVVETPFEVLEFFMSRGEDKTAINGRIYYDTHRPHLSVLSLGGMCYKFNPEEFPTKAIGNTIRHYEYSLREEEERARKSNVLNITGNDMASMLRQLDIRPRQRSRFTNR